MDKNATILLNKKQAYKPDSVLDLILICHLSSLAIANKI